MTSSRVARVVELVLLAACLGIGAELVTTIGASPRASTARDPASAAPAPQPARSDRQIIVERNLFQGSALRSAPPVAAPQSEPETLVATRLPLRLLGTAAAASGAWAAIEDERTHRMRVVRTGETLLDAATLLRIERRRVVIQNGAVREALALDDERELAQPLRRPPSPEAAAAAMGERIQQLAETSFAKEPKPAPPSANPPHATQIAPRIELGQVTGVQLSAIERGSVFDALGIREGDTVTQVNGVVATNHQDSVALLRELTEASELEVSVVGADGAARTLSRALDD